MRGFLKAIFNRNTVLLWILILIPAFLCLKSWVPGTWLFGWDTLHPEFNFGLAFERLFFGVFRSEQGLGAVAAHSHMADLPRVAFLAINSLIFPAYILRYLFISFCLVVGTAGIYIFIKKILLNNSGYSGVFAFLGGLFYLLNLGTLQQFYVPFEMFTVQFAVLPWLFYFASKYLLQSGRKNLVFFGLVTLLSAPMAFASTLWFAFFLAFILYLAVFLKSHFKKVINLIVLTLVINSFWLLPAAYFVISGNASLVSLVKTNKIFSQEAFSYNKSYGTLSDALILKNFLLDWLALDNQNNFGYLFDNWRQYLAKPYVLPIGYVLSGVALAGAAYGTFKRSRIALALIFPSILSLVFLINQNPPVDFLFTLFREKIPLFGEAMRFPFTKFSIIFVFTLTCFFALGQKFLYSVMAYVTRLKLSRILIIIQLISFTVLFFIYMRPAFSGDFISKKIQVVIPKEYFEMFDWFNSQPDGRVATFPVHSFWGWVYYKWGFQGAQFISFGIKQPLMDRDYDRWNKDNEEYFRQISFAVYSQDISLLEKVLTKYRISYLMVDRNVLAPGKDQDQKVLFNDEIESLFSASSQINFLRKFGNISIYLFKPIVSNNPLVTDVPQFVTVGENLGPQDIDWIYKDYGDYLVQNKTTPQLFLPFRSLIDNQNIVRSDLVVTDGKVIQLLTGNLPKVNLPFWNTYLQNELSLPAELYTKRKDNVLTVKFVPKIFQVTGDKNKVSLFYQVHEPSQDASNNLLINIDNYQTISVNNMQSTDFTYQGTVFLSTNTLNNLAIYSVNDEKKEEGWNILDTISKLPVQFCSVLGSNQEVEMIILGSSGIRLTAKNSQGCIRIPLNKVIKKSDLTDYKDLVHFKFKIASPANTFGHYCIFDTTLNRCIKEQNFLPEGSVEDFVLTDSGSLDKLELTLFLDGVNNVEDISYLDFSFAVSSPVGFLTVSPEDLQRAFNGLRMESNSDNKLQLGELSENSTLSFNLLEHDQRPRFCGTLLPKTYTRTINLAQGFIEYSSTNGSSCDYFTFPNLPHNEGWLLFVDSENIAGLPLRMCVANTSTKRCDLSVVLPENKNLTAQLFLLPPINDGGVGYNVHFDNYSVGRIITTNRIKQLKIISFPYYWISKMQFAGNSTNLRQTSKMEIESVKQIFPGAMILNIVNEQNPGLLTLNRSFEEGWFGSSGEHVKVDGWANGWLINKVGEQKVYIFYWPQLLEWGGFILMIGTFLYVGIRYLDKR